MLSDKDYSEQWMDLIPASAAVTEIHFSDPLNSLFSFSYFSLFLYVPIQ